MYKHSSIICPAAWIRETDKETTRIVAINHSENFI